MDSAWIKNRVVQAAAPIKDFELYITDVATDIFAISASAIIIDAAAISDDSREMIFDFFIEVGNQANQTVFWLGYPKPPHPLRARFRCYQNFEELAVKLKYHLLSAHRKSKKAIDFSKKLADSLQILSMIRSYPGIRTQELSQQLELPTRTVQRYISTLQAAGKWIEYDTAQKGWKLQQGISILFGDHLREDI